MLNNVYDFPNHWAQSDAQLYGYIVLYSKANMSEALGFRVVQKIVLIALWLTT
jgi:hypothetical protein